MHSWMTGLKELRVAGMEKGSACTKFNARGGAGMRGLGQIASAKRACCALGYQCPRFCSVQHDQGLLAVVRAVLGHLQRKGSSGSSGCMS